MANLSRMFLIALILSLIPPAGVRAQDTPGGAEQVGQLLCPDANLWGSNLITQICWSCLFPLRLMGSDLGGGSAPAGAADQSVCVCEDPLGVPEVGIAVGAWMPARLIEVVRQPYCSPSLGGTVLRRSLYRWGMPDGAGGGSSDNQYYNYHYFSFPLFSIIDLLAAPECNAGGFVDFDLMYISEVDPTWNLDELALFTHPEVAVFANPLMQAACSADCVASSAGDPIDSLYWCAGCWGGMYPFTGNVPAGGSPPRVTSLLASRAVAALHRRGLAWKTVGNAALCGGYIHPMIPKSQYKLSLLYPLAEAGNTLAAPGDGSSSPSGEAGLTRIGDRDGGCCHAIGASTFFWGEWRNIPAVGEDYLYLLWRWTDCCLR